MKDQGETHIVHSFPRTNEETFQLAIRKYRGKCYIDFRVWFQAEGSSTLIPSKKGISLYLDHLPELRKGMDRLAKAAEKFRVHEDVAV